MGPEGPGPQNMFYIFWEGLGASWDLGGQLCFFGFGPNSNFWVRYPPSKTYLSKVKYGKPLCQNMQNLCKNLSNPHPNPSPSLP